MALTLRTKATTIGTLAFALLLTLAAVLLVSTLESRLTEASDQLMRTRVQDLLEQARSGDLWSEPFGRKSPERPLAGIASNRRDREQDQGRPEFIGSEIECPYRSGQAKKRNGVVPDTLARAIGVACPQEHADGRDAEGCLIQQPRLAIVETEGPHQHGHPQGEHDGGTAGPRIGKPHDKHIFVGQHPPQRHRRPRAA